MELDAFESLVVDADQISYYVSALRTSDGAGVMQAAGLQEASTKASSGCDIAATGPSTMLQHHCVLLQADQGSEDGPQAGLLVALDSSGPELKVSVATPGAPNPRVLPASRLLSAALADAPSLQGAARLAASSGLAPLDVAVAVAKSRALHSLGELLFHRARAAELRESLGRRQGDGRPQHLEEDVGGTRELLEDHEAGVQREAEAVAAAVRVLEPLIQRQRQRRRQRQQQRRQRAALLPAHPL